MEKEKITSQDVAKLAGVSQSTVSFVLNNRTDITISAETRNRVIQAAKALRYGPFKDPGADLYEYVAVILPTLDNPYYVMMLKLLESECAAADMRILLFCTDKSVKKEKMYLTTLASSSVSAIIYTFTPQAATETKTLAKTKRLFIIGEVNFEIDASIMTLNSKRAGYLMAEYLHSLGHRKMAFISNPINRLSISRQCRLEGISEYLKKAGLPDISVFSALSEDDTDNEVETGYNETVRMLHENKGITAVIGVNDYTALGILNALLDAGLSVPDDISVAGFDHIPLMNFFRPTLTTVDHFLTERIRYTVNLITEKSSHKQNMIITYDPILIKRDSTGVTTHNS